MFFPPPDTQSRSHTRHWSRTHRTAGGCCNVRHRWLHSPAGRRSAFASSRRAAGQRAYRESRRGGEPRTLGPCRFSCSPNQLPSSGSGQHRVVSLDDFGAQVVASVQSVVKRQSTRLFYRPHVREFTLMLRHGRPIYACVLLASQRRAARFAAHLVERTRRQFGLKSALPVSSGIKTWPACFVGGLTWPPIFVVRRTDEQVSPYPEDCRGCPRRLRLFRR
jgi:hypothetical protein